MHSQLKTLRAERFLEAAMAYLEPLRGSYIYEPIARDYLLKTEQHDGGYSRWFRKAFDYFEQRYGLKDPVVLDFGCGAGELTVLLNSLGYNAKGIDVHEKHLELARILAEENGLPPSIFILNKTKRLPFEDKSVDVITLLVVLEHLDDSALTWLLPELRRICRGLIYVLVPNKLQSVDDHTGLRFVPWMPRWLASIYVGLHGRKRKYSISEDSTWDVHYRSFNRIIALFRQHGFSHELPPDDLVFPPLELAPPIRRIGKTIQNSRYFFGIPLPVATMMKLGFPKQGFYPYLNLIFQPTERHF